MSGYEICAQAFVDETDKTPSGNFTGFAAYYTDPEFLNTVMTGNKSWVYKYDPETKAQLS